MSKIQEWVRRIKEYPKLQEKYDTVQKEYNSADAERYSLSKALHTAEREKSAYQALCKKLIPSTVTFDMAEQMYFAIAPVYDSEGFELFRAGEQILGKFDYGSFYYEDARGYFEEMDGYGLLRYLEADNARALGDHTENRCEIVPGTTCDRWVNLNVNHETKEYKEYLDKLYRIVLSNLGILEPIK